MIAVIRWRRAMVLSLLLHSIVLAGVGWMTANALLVRDRPEQYVELALITDELREDGTAVSERIAVSVPGQAAATGVPAEETTVKSGEAIPAATTFADGMEVLAAGTAGNSDGGNISPGGAGSTAISGGGGAAGSSANLGKGGGIIPPGVLSRVEPDYPEQARQHAHQGTVILKIQIMANGRPGSVSVYRSSGFAVLDDAAIAAAQQWRFVPAKERESGQNIVCHTTVPIVFRLNQ